MANGKRKFTDAQKLDILSQAEQQGISHVLRLHSLSYSVFSNWREKFGTNDPKKKEAFLNNKARSELKQYMHENAILKKIIASQALELERKEEELRRNSQLYGKR